MADKDVSFLKPEQSIALNRYTYKVDGHINNYLRNGKQTYMDYLNSLGDHSFYNVKLLLCVPENLDKTKSIEYMVKKIKEYIHEIQEAFKSAKRTTKNTSSTNFYRHWLMR